MRMYVHVRVCVRVCLGVWECPSITKASSVFPDTWDPSLQADGSQAAQH